MPLGTQTSMNKCVSLQWGIWYCCEKADVLVQPYLGEEAILSAVVSLWEIVFARCPIYTPSQVLFFNVTLMLTFEKQ